MEWIKFDKDLVPRNQYQVLDKIIDLWGRFSNIRYTNCIWSESYKQWYSMTDGCLKGGDINFSHYMIVTPPAKGD